MTDLADRIASALATAVPPVLTDDELLAGLRLEQERRGVLPNSIDFRERRIRAFAAWLAPRGILDARTEDVQRWLDSLGLVAASRRNYLAHLHRLFAFAVEEGHVATDPTARIVRPKQRRGLPRPISDQDLTRALDPARLGSERYVHRRLRCLLCLGAFEGLRAQEAAGIFAEDVDLAGGQLRIRAGKGGKERTVPLHPKVVDALVALPLPDSGPVFRSLGDEYHGGTGEQLKPYRVSHLVNDYLHGLGIKSSCHTLRHWHGSALYRATLDLRLVQEELGHSSPATTSIYAAFDTTRAGPAVRSLGVG